MPFRFLFCLVTIWLSCAPAHSTTVAFLEQRWPDGRLVQLEPGGRFSHTAIKIGRKWLHAYPSTGVDLVYNIERYGDHVVYLRNDAYSSPTLWQVQKWIGKPFDWAYRWAVENSTYCSRLVAELLHIPPRSLGLSPDELYEELLKRGFKPVGRCEEVLSNG